jgi:hypothetical protein
VQRALPILALAGLLAIVLAGDYQSNALPLAIDREQAIAAADAVLKDRGITLGPDWQRLSAIRLASDDVNAWLWHKFVWREAGQDAYARLMGTWLAPPLWEVRYARFEGGDVADRAEEWRVTVDGSGKVRQIRHQLPEQRAGAKLSQADARSLAQQEIRHRFDLDPAALRGYRPRSRSARRVPIGNSPIPIRVSMPARAARRVLIALAGDEVVSAGRYVFVPEDWQRAERERAGRMSIAKMGVGLAVVILSIAALIAAIIAWNRGRFDRRAFWLAATLVGISAAVGGVNRWPVFAMHQDGPSPTCGRCCCGSQESVSRWCW